jgi:hypothetical protein
LNQYKVGMGQVDLGEIPARRLIAIVGLLDLRNDEPRVHRQQQELSESLDAHPPAPPGVCGACNRIRSGVESTTCFTLPSSAVERADEPSTLLARSSENGGATLCIGVVRQAGRMPSPWILGRDVVHDRIERCRRGAARIDRVAVNRGGRRSAAKC